MHVTINGERHELAPGATVDDALSAIGAPRSGVAVAVDGEVVPRVDWAVAKLGDGAVIEVLTAVQGG
ncbi:sulfur carrier protein [Pseudonocardia thermophila]|jgi:thiamine biosynthesis protein ThiS|uniref:Sulfur carrier protein n=1 Tax=Pseudonocardia thermophila TaxID=1848 RepID=A0A1M6RV35_PSETH|nr:sulfur carrier protein ThiS [Pseudonocardia thermophila]SHK36137.1 sulfur carrier protein [Pseudonocardia thermophila]